VGKGEKLFNMVKLRSMVKNADKSGVDSTSANDMRITRVGHLIRKYKLDEITQLWNVLIGDMSLVGPRPNVKRETDLYTTEEKKLLSVRPGITDISSIVFADEGDILKDAADPDIAYNQLIRPYKSRLGILYVEHAGLWLDIRLVFLTALAILDRQKALTGVQRILAELRCDPDLAHVARRAEPLLPAPPPGATEIVQTRQIAA
jgi:lipopolysaccharide/colanic/teichoic acid biosynthesis glycosyltransferase